MRKAIKNYYFARDVRKLSDELPWLRIAGIETVSLPRPVVLVNGAFDLLTASHMRLLSIARDKAGAAGTVLCALDSDEKIASRKGPSRPILSFAERAANLSYMPISCLVEINNDADMKKLVEFVQPDLRILGGEYRSAKTRFPQIPVCFVPDHGLHASDIISRILERNKTYGKEN